MRAMAVIFCCILLGPGARTEAADSKAAEIVAAAIRAHGGAERLEQTRLMIRKSKGTMFVFGQPIAFTDEMVLQLPDRWRHNVDLDNAGQKAKILVVVNGNRGWQSNGGPGMDIDRERLSELREESYITWLATILPLKTDQSLQLEALAEAQVGGRPADVLKVSRKGNADAKLYFDQQTHRLVKIEHRGREAGLAVDKEYLYGGYEANAGLPLPTTYTELNDGKKFVDAKNITYEFPSKVDEQMFQKP
jgi:hypothetical protein